MWRRFFMPTSRSILSRECFIFFSLVWTVKFHMTADSFTQGRESVQISQVTHVSLLLLIFTTLSRCFSRSISHFNNDTFLIKRVLQIEIYFYDYLKRMSLYWYCCNRVLKIARSFICLIKQPPAKFPAINFIAMLINSMRLPWSIENGAAGVMNAGPSFKIRKNDAEREFTRDVLFLVVVHALAALWPASYTRKVCICVCVWSTLQSDRIQFGISRETRQLALPVVTPAWLSAAY